MVRDLTIKVNDLIKTYGTSDALIVTFLDGNSPISNLPFQIKINGVTYNRVTDSYGEGKLNINLTVGSYTATIVFNGSAEYNQQSKEVFVRVLPNRVVQPETKQSKNYFEINGIPLFVKLNDGFSVTPGISIKETDMLKQTTTMNAPTFYFNTGNHGIKFEISVLMRPTDYWGNATVMDYIDEWFKTMTPVTVVTDALDVPNAKYIVKVKSKKQTKHNFSVWKLEFKQYYEDDWSFEKFYTEKTASLSVEDLQILKETDIGSYSSYESVQALKRKLSSVGYWTPTMTVSQTYVATGEVFTFVVPRQFDGYWDSRMKDDIYKFQVEIMGISTKQGVCDKDTINALVRTGNRTYVNNIKYNGVDNDVYY